MKVQVGFDVFLVEGLNHRRVRRCAYTPCAFLPPRHSWPPPIRCRCSVEAAIWSALSARCSTVGPPRRMNSLPLPTPFHQRVQVFFRTESPRPGTPDQR
jgi:hypothetical protein